MIIEQDVQNVKLRGRMIYSRPVMKDLNRSVDNAGMCGKMEYNDDWCIEEEKKYIFGGSAEVYLPTDLTTLHEHLRKEITNFFINVDQKLLSKEFREAMNEIKDIVIKIIDKQFGPRL